MKYQNLQIGTLVVLGSFEDSPVYEIAWRDGDLIELLYNGESCGFAHTYEVEEYDEDIN